MTPNEFQNLDIGDLIVSSDKTQIANIKRRYPKNNRCWEVTIVAGKPTFENRIMIISHPEFWERIDSGFRSWLMLQDGLGEQ